MAATKESIVMSKGSLKIYFDIIIPTKDGTIYCDYFNCTVEVQGGALEKNFQ